MKQADKIGQLFRKNQYKLEEMPSSQSWDKLRRRLDDRKRRETSFSMYRYFAMVAAMVGLVVIATTVFNLAKPIPKQAHKTIKELSAYSPEALKTAIEAHQFRTTHQSALQQTIEEGHPSKLLVHKQAKRPILVPKKKETI